MIYGDLTPLRRGAAAQAQRLRHSDDAAEFLRSLEDDRVSFTHSTAHIARLNVAGQAPLYTLSGILDGKSGMGSSDGVGDTLGQKMRAARESARKTQDDVAEQLGITKGAVSQWENDATKPTLKNLRAYCLVVGASADDLLLEHGMDALLRQLVGIWDQLSPDARDTLLGNANRLLTEEKPEPGPHNPFGRRQVPKRKSVSKQAKRPRL